MKKSTYLEAAIMLTVTQNGETIPSAASRIGMANSTIYKLIKGSRPEIETLKQICNELALTETQKINLAQSYLLDEINRLGLADKIKISFPSSKNEPDSRTIQTIAAIAVHNDEIKSLLEYLVAIIPQETITIPLGDASKNRIQKSRDEDTSCIQKVDTKTKRKHARIHNLDTTSPRELTLNEPTLDEAAQAVIDRAKALKK